MPQTASTNRRFVLAERPRGVPTAATLRLEEAPIPSPGPGQMLLRTCWLSLDPYMRGRMSAAPSYAPPVALGEVMVGGTVAVVEESHLPEFKPGDRIACYSGWQDYALSDGRGVRRLPESLDRPSLALGALGMPGLTAYGGLLDIGRPKPGETLVVAAATGAVGAIVGQIARIKGCHVVGIAGGPEKCLYAREALGFDACLDHRLPDLAPRLQEACPNGIDIYWENVGGAVFEAVLPLLNPAGRVPVCGLIAHYNAERLPDGPDRTPLLLGSILRKRLRVQGFIVFNDYGHLQSEFEEQMTRWISEGDVQVQEDVVEGLEQAPEAFIGLLAGKNFGKLLVRVAQL